MVQPFDYRLNVASPFESLAQGYQLGAGIAQNRQAAQARELAMQKERQEMERQAIISQEVQAFRNAPSIEGALRLSTLVPPEQSKVILDAYAALGEEGQRKALAFSGQVLSAFQSGANDVGLALLRERAQGARNVGDQQNAQAFDTWAKIAEANPQMATASIASMVGLLPGGDKVLDGVFKAQKAPAEMRKGEAEADEAEVKARLAPSTIISDLEKKRWDIKKIQNDIEVSKLNAREYQLNNRIAAARNELEKNKLILQLDNLRRERDTAISDRVAEAETAQYNIADMRSSVKNLREHPGFKSLFGATLAPGARYIPGTDAAGAESVLEELKSRAFVLGAQKMRGLGALGEKEGAKIEAALAALRAGMPERDALAALSAIESAMSRLDALNQKKYGIPSAASLVDQSSTSAPPSAFRVIR